MFERGFILTHLKPNELRTMPSIAIPYHRRRDLNANVIKLYIVCVCDHKLSGKSHIFSRLSHCIFSVASLLLPPFYSAASNLNCSKYSVRATHHNKTQLEQQIHIATTLHVFIYPPLDGWMDG